MKERYHISGMTCSACSSHVEKSVSRLEGVEKASVNLLTETMEVSYDESTADRSQVMAAVEKAGYGAVLLIGGDRGRSSGKQSTLNAGHNGEDPGRLDRENKKEGSAMKWRLGISLGFLIPLMYVAMYHMYYQWFGLPIPGFIMDAFHGTPNAMNFAVTQFLLVLPILYVNRKFFEVGFKTLFHLSPNMDSLIALGSAAAVGYGIFAMYRISYGLGHGAVSIVEQYSHDLYFESAGMILTLITLGKYLETRSKGKTSEAISKLMDLSPKTAIILNEQGEEVEIPTEQLQKNDIFLVKPGSLIPVDGTVLEGSSSVDEAAITGESVPVEKQAGDKVVSATMNKAGFLKCSADRVGEDTTLSQIIRLVEEASASKAPIAQLADKVAGVFVPVVIGIALVTLAGWILAGGGAEFAISSAIAVLVISCPCALGLATPVAIMVGTGVGAGHGILIKSGEALQQAREIDTVVLDKTGTITEGNLRVMQIVCVKDGVKEEKLLALAAALEKKSEHPLAEAVVAAWEEAQALGKLSSGVHNGNDPVKKISGSAGSLLAVTDFKAVFGRGISGRISDADAHPAGAHYTGSYFLGNLPYLKESHIYVDQAAQEQINRLADEGQTPLLVADDTQLLGIIGVADQLKESSREAIDAWTRMGIHVIMLTGDNARTAEAVRRKLNLEEVVAEVLPQDKEKKISQLKKNGRKAAMIGDGINDAPALAAAHVGMAIGAGTDVAMESADVILMKSDLRDAVTAMRLSRAVIRNIKQNLFWAFFYNCIGIPLAAGLLYPAFGLRLTPMFGAAAMSLSSIFVVGNALRLKSFRSSFRPSAVRKDDTGVNNKNLDEKNQTLKEQNEWITESRCDTNMKMIIQIEGMSCGHCTARVQKVLEAVEGVKSAVVSLEEKTATVEAEAGISKEALAQAVADAGYEVTGIENAG